MFQNGIFGVSGKHMVLLSRLQSALGMSGDEGDGGSTVFLTVTQVAGDVGRFTPVEPAINYLKYYKVRLGLEIPKVINFLSGLASKSLSLSLSLAGSVPLLSPARSSHCRQLRGRVPHPG